MSRLITNAIRSTSASADAITLDGSGNATFPANVTCSGTATGFGVQGITMADQWRITSSFQVSSQAFIQSNWERNDSTGYNKIGTGMSESSGVFSFPSTGIYLVKININWYASGGGSNYLRVSIHHTTNNSDYYVSNYSYSGVANNAQNNNMMADTIFDVTDVSTHKIKFETLGSNTYPYVTGNSTYNLSYATFIRLGDT